VEGAIRYSLDKRRQDLPRLTSAAGAEPHCQYPCVAFGQVLCLAAWHPEAFSRARRLSRASRGPSQTQADRRDRGHGRVSENFKVRPKSPQSTAGCFYRKPMTRSPNGKPRKISRISPEIMPVSREISSVSRLKSFISREIRKIHKKKLVSAPGVTDKNIRTIVS